MAGLSAQQVKAIEKPGRYGDGGGLFLVVTTRGTKQWIQRITVDGKRTDKGLGGYPHIALREARKLAKLNRTAVDNGRNPWTEPKAVPATPTLPVDQIPTLAEAVYATLEHHAGAWRESTATRWIHRIKKYALPVLGDRLVTDITRADMRELLTPIWRTQNETAIDLRQSLGQVFTWAMALEYRIDNPSDKALEMGLPKVRRETVGRRALHHTEVKGAIEKIRDADAWDATQLALEFLVLTGARNAEVRGMTWDEIEGDVWTVPASRAKTRTAHRIPLSMRCQMILSEAKALRGQRGNYVFTSPTRDMPLSEKVFVRRLKDIDVDCHPHGFRTSIAVWLAEEAEASYEVGEHVLGHAIGNSTTRAYRRTDLLEERKVVMEMWADYVDPTPSPF